MTVRVRLRLAVVALPTLALLTAAAPAPTPPAVLRIPAFVAVPRLAEPDDHVLGGEFASPVRTRADRATLGDSIERARSIENQRWAQTAGRAIVVPLRRARY